MLRIDELVLYRARQHRDLLEMLTEAVVRCEEKTQSADELRGAYFTCIHKLVDLAGKYGFTGNLWHCYLTLLLVEDENVFSTACEIKGMRSGSLSELAKHDFGIFLELFSLSFELLDVSVGSMLSDTVCGFHGSEDAGQVFNRRIRDTVCELSRKLASAKSVDEFYDLMVDFYRCYGVGKFGLHKAFRVQHDEDGVQIVPITNIAHVYLEDLVGYESAKKKLIDNTEAFVNGKRANNCLLFGDAGTGKSSSIKGILNRYYDKGLRIIEVYKHQFQDLNDIIAQIKNRNYRFIIYMDDLSFEEFEIEYKYLKAVIEGGLEKRPENVLIYATSNRRHLIKERFDDRDEGMEDVHISDTAQEKLSLFARFGVSIFFCAPDKKQFQTIVKTLANRYGVTMDEDKLMLEANRWELSHGSMSGRMAQQFIDYLLGQQAE
ncbi:MAG: ATP-binding protein [Lachnospiraceae bacterium]|nr:ATP-binding protein [Lachnospiraceae bacterium]